MRISDWSSDVCSSDLAAFGYLVTLLPLDGGDPHVQVAGQVVLIWLMFAINLLGPKPVAKFQSLCVVFGLAPVALVLMFGWGSFDREVYDAAWNVSGESDAAVVFGSLAPRSEEHTSELQSLMRISYAVFC